MLNSFREKIVQRLYTWVGVFTVVMMLYLFIAPKLVKKSAGEAPRSGSNEEAIMIAQTNAQMMGPAPTATPGLPYTLPNVGGQGFRVYPEGGRGPAQEGLSFGGSNPAGFKVGQAYRGRRQGRRALRGFRPRSNLFPFANVAIG